MSNLDRTPDLTSCGGLAGVAPRPVHEVFAGKEVPLGEWTSEGSLRPERVIVRRLLPNLGRRLVGAWCFVDHYGAGDTADVSDSAGMQVPPHPHIGLQTVSWLLAGTVRHRDSLGSDQLIEPGQLGLMTAGTAITHAEQSPVPHPALLHGVQLWVALPAADRGTAPAWEHHASLPVITGSGATITVIMGTVGGASSPGRAYSPLVGADVTLDADADLLLPLEPEFEHAALVLSGSVDVDGVPLAPGSMLYLGCARRDLAIASEAPARLLLLGGVPFEEHIVMWWNFVARNNDEIVAARADWTSGSRFPDVAGYDGYRLSAPVLPPGRLKPGGAVR